MSSPRVKSAGVWGDSSATGAGLVSAVLNIEVLGSEPHRARQELGLVLPYCGIGPVPSVGSLPNTHESSYATDPSPSVSSILNSTATSPKLDPNIDLIEPPLKSLKGKGLGGLSATDFLEDDVPRDLIDVLDLRDLDDPRDLRDRWGATKLDVERDEGDT